MASVKLMDEYWRRESDHAKWAVTVDKHWICIGDINREVILTIIFIISPMCGSRKRSNNKLEAKDVFFYLLPSVL